MNTISIAEGVTGTVAGTDFTLNPSSEEVILGHVHTVTGLTVTYAAINTDSPNRPLKGAIVVNTGDVEVYLRVDGGAGANSPRYGFFPLPVGAVFIVRPRSDLHLIGTSTIADLSARGASGTTGQVSVHAWW